MFTYCCVNILPGGSALHRHTASHVGRGEDGGNDATETGHVDQETSVIAQPAKSASRHLRHCSACKKCVTSFGSLLSLQKVRRGICVIAQSALHKVGHVICHGSARTKCVTLFTSLFSLHKVRHIVIVQSAQSASRYLSLFNLHKVLHVICHCSVCTKCFTLFVIAQSAQSASRYLSLLSLHKVLHVICHCSVCTKCVTLFVFVQSAQSADRRDEGMQADCMTNPRSWILFIYRQQAPPSVGRSVRVKSNRNLLLPRKRP